MQHAELIALIRDGVPEQSRSTWADLGAGSGNFTLALRDLLAADATIIAVDRNAGSLSTLTRRAPDIQTLTGDFTHALSLPPLDGILMANALHFNGQQQAVLAHLRQWLKPGGRLLIVEYDLQRSRAYVPRPVDLARFQTLATGAGYEAVRQVGYRRSPRDRTGMYAAVALNPLA